MRLDFKTGSFYVGDCLEIMPKLGAGSIDMVLCDLPYEKTQNQWDEMIPFDLLWPSYWSALKSNGPAVLTGSHPFTSFAVVSQIRNYKHCWAWEKTEASGHYNAKKMPLCAHEDVLVFCRGPVPYFPQKTSGHPRKTATQRNAKESTNYGTGSGKPPYDSTERYPRSVIKFATDKQKGAWHPTQKPVALFEYLIRTYTNPGELVLDNCAGSGTTAIAAMQSGRRWICIEQNEEYANAAMARIWEAEAAL